MKNFNSEKEASTWMYNVALLGEDCIDNYRFAFQDESWSMEKYNEIFSNGCCGSFDEEIMVVGRIATIGCNYGH